MNNCHARIVLKLNDMQNYALKFSPEIQKISNINNNINN